MKKLRLLLFLAVILVAGIGLRAQEVTRTLMPGWTWISCPTTDTLDFATAMGSFVPMQNDIITTQGGAAVYMNGRWVGTVSRFYPGYGYHYKSNRAESITVTFQSQQPVLHVVTTLEPIDITVSSAVVGGTVTLPEGSHVFLCGVCWDIEPNPTIDGSHTSEETGVGSFNSTLMGLSTGTVYYVRAYAVTDYGLAYGEELSFTTKSGIPEVSTTEVIDITATSATCGGAVTDDGGLDITAWGICWGTEPNPTIEGSHTSEEIGIGSFSSSLTDLSANTTYYVRAYVSNSNVTVYGNELSFTTESSSTAPTGAIDGKFTINDNSDQVFFSQGNLQYIGSAAEPYWKFADNQWDILGTTTGQNSNSSNVDRDLFGWGTSGWNCGNAYYRPWDTFNSSGSSYGPAGTNNLTEAYVNADWGVYNPIFNGGNQPNQWRTLTKDEWGYVFDTRTTASGIRYAKANVNEVNGVILLPDDWSINYYDLNDANTNDANYTSNVITASEWNTLEQHGAVFLPATGYRFGTLVNKVGVNGYYWSSIYVNGTYAYGVYFLDSNVNPQDCSNRTYGRGVRLVYVTE